MVPIAVARSAVSLIEINVHDDHRLRGRRPATRRSRHRRVCGARRRAAGRRADGGTSGGAGSDARAAAGARGGLAHRASARGGALDRGAARRESEVDAAGRGEARLPVPAAAEGQARSAQGKPTRASAAATSWLPSSAHHPVLRAVQPRVLQGDGGEGEEGEEGAAGANQGRAGRPVGRRPRHAPGARSWHGVGGQVVGQERRRHVRHWRRPHVHGGVAVEARARRRQGRGPRLRDEAPTRVDRGGARARSTGAGDVGNDRRLCELSEQSRSRGARRNGGGAQGADEPRAQPRTIIR